MSYNWVKSREGVANMTFILVLISGIMFHIAGLFKGRETYSDYAEN